jgi:8-oxo-dGTP pyrophosphatase MutT (NUDIX family)
MRFDEVLRQIEEGLARPLPGAAAQEHLAPRPRREWPAGFNPARARHAAGLLLLYPVDGEATTLLTERPATLDRHGGQVSLPGGAVEPGETFEQTALREAHEEVGLDPSFVRTLGPLTPVDIPVSGFRLHPIAAVAGRRPRLSPSDREVARLLDIPLRALAHPEAVAWRALARDGQTVHIPAFLMSGVEIWGATAMVLAELLALAGWSGPARSGP